MFLKYIDKVPEKCWETIGLLFGVVANLAIAFQIVHEFKTPGSSSISIFHLLSFTGIYIFWTLYGIRFRRIAVWLTNGLAMILQFSLMVICLFF